MRHARIATFALAAAALAAIPFALTADDAACSVTASSLADSLLNPPTGEDTDFFVTEGGIPNIALVLDTSESMLRVAPDGAARTWGSFQDPTPITAGGAPRRYGCVNAYADDQLKFQSSCGTTSEEGNPYNPAVHYPTLRCPYMDQAG